MSLLDSVLAGSERRSGPSPISDPQGWLMSLLTGGAQDTYSGKSVTPTSALSLVPVYSAVTLLSGAVGSMPLVVYKRADGGRERATDHRTFKLLHEQPNDLHGADEFWELMMVHVLLWGNALAAKGRGPDGLVNELIPLDPRRCTIGWDTKRGEPVYSYAGLDGVQRTAGPNDILHIRGLSIDGVIGLSPIQQARQQLANQMAQEEFQGRFWKHNARPGGVLKHPQELSDKAAKRLKASWESAHGGLANAGRVAILEEGLEWQQLGLPLADAQFIEQARFGRSEVALLFRVPPYMLAAESGSPLTYSTVDGQALDFAKWSLRRWTTRIEGSLKRDPDIFLQGSRFYPEFLYDDMLKADAKTRAEVYSNALGKWMTRDEIRERENLNLLTDDQRTELDSLAKSATPTLNVQQQPATDQTGGN